MFDFKLIILLGLTLIIYLLHKEVEEQRKQITTCETHCINLYKLSKLFITQNVSTVIDTLKKPSPQVIQETPQIEINKHEVLDLSSTFQQTNKVIYNDPMQK